MKRAAIAVLVLLLPACTVGNGDGFASGKLFLKSCYGTSANDDFGTLAAPWDFNLGANFYSGEPIEDVKKGGSDNRLVIRMQGSGTRIEDSDMLVFDVDTWRVAQCMRGDAAVLAQPELVRFCARDAASPSPKLRIGPGFPVRVHMALRKRCPGNPYVVATARDVSIATGNTNADQWTSWVRLKEFGDASRVDIQPSFKVEFGQLLEAESFALDMLDDRVVKAEYAVKTPASEPIPEPHVRATLSGRFRFELQRGQGAQTFP